MGSGPDRERVAALYREWGPLIFRRCRRILGSDEDASDAVQEVFVTFMRNLDRFEDRGQTLNFLYRVATNWCLNLLKRRKVAPSLLEADSPEIPNHRVPETLAADRDHLLSIFQRCDERTRLILFLSIADGLSQEEIADVTGLSRKTVGLRLARARDAACKEHGE